MAKAIDLTGKLFGRLTVIERAEDYVQPNGRKDVMWKCKCSCGEEVEIRGTCLRSGRTTSCGCKVREVKNDLTGRKFGKLIVLYRGENEISARGTSYVKWVCQCECGNTVTVRADALKRGRTKSCGCIHSRLALHEDLTGRVFGRLTVIEKDLERTTCYSYPYWKTICDCGNTSSVLSASLIDGHTKSCGCLSADLASERNRMDLTNQRFGRLVVLNLHEVKQYSNNNSTLIWKCQCDCGNIAYSQAGALINGHTQSCGCYNKDRLREVHTGENNFSWKGGVTPLVNAIRRCTQYGLWREDVFKKDGYICKKSGNSSGFILNAHHIKPFHTIIEENHITTLKDAYDCEELWNPDNGDTLCKEAHMDFHSQYRFDYSLEDYLQWVSATPSELAEELRCS